MGTETATIGQGWAVGAFSSYLADPFLADCVVIGADGKENQCHGLLLSYHSEFFRKALANTGLQEGRLRRVELRMPDPYSAWPQLLRYFYTGSIEVEEGNAAGLLSVARMLVVPVVEEGCREFIKQQLNFENCMRYMRQAVMCDDGELQEACTQLAAQGFATVFASDTCGFPASALLAILEQPDLEAQCEEQVLEFVLRYIRTTSVSDEECAALFQQVRYAYLPNERFAELQHEPQVPRSLLLEAALARITSLKPAAAAPGSSCGGPTPGTTPRWAAGAAPDWGCGAAARSSGSDGEGGGSSAPLSPCGSLSSSSLPAPRPSYCCQLNDGLPGGLPYVVLPVEEIWAELAACIRVQVSGVSEGGPRNALSDEPGQYFGTNESDAAMNLPWIEVQLPPNVVLTHLRAYSFKHGHARTSFYRMRSWRAQAGSTSSTRPGSTFVDLEADKVESSFNVTARKSTAREQLTVSIKEQPPLEDWRILRLQSTGLQQDGVYRLSVKALRLYGTVRVDLMEQGQGLRLTHAVIERALAAGASAAPPSE